jgi:cation transport regulator ChaB
MPSEPQPAPEWKPNPDPSSVTNDAIERAVKAERDYVMAQLAVLRQRMDDRDEATKVLHETVTRVPTDMQLAIGHLRDIVNEKFLSVQTQFQERDERAVRESTANTVAVNAAFAAQKEAAAEQNKSNTLAINKSETATKEAIAKLAELVATGMDALSDKIDDLKTRQYAAEQAIYGFSREKQGGTDMRAAIFAAVLVLVTIAGFLGFAIHR